MMKNRLHLVWPDNKVDVFHGIKTVERAWDAIFRRNVENIKGAVYTDKNGVSERLLPKTMSSENSDQVPVPEPAPAVL